MNRRGRGYSIPVAIIVVLACALLGVNNPNPPAYAQILAKEMNQHQPPSFVRDLTKLFSPLVASYIERESTRQNWLLFSVYTTTLPNGTTLRMLAVFNQLLPLSGIPTSASG